MRQFICCVICIIFCKNTHGQEFGAMPPRIKWRQINTDSLRVIFPDYADSIAIRAAHIIGQIAANNENALGGKINKIDIVLQNHTVTSNGYVGLGPFRSEFFLMPPSDNFEQGLQYWPDQLALHEYRHVQQYNNFNTGLSRVMRTLFGQDGYALAINAAIPNWFFEGDAVYQETILSRQGRGRAPFFLKAYPALWSDGKQYKWMKLRNGSYKDYVPNHYDLGYLLVNYGYEKYGNDFWKNVTQDAAAYKGLFYPFQRAIKKNAGLRYQQFRDSAFDYYKNIFRQDGSSGSRNEFLSVNHKTLTNYYFPQQISKGNIVYLKISNKERPAFYKRDSVGEHRIAYRHIASDEQFSYKNGKIVYAAVEKDARWGYLDYSVIKLLDVHSGKTTNITSKTRYFAPDISENGKLVVANHIDLHGNASLVLIDPTTGKPIMNFNQQDIAYYANPKFLSNASEVVAAVRTRSGESYLAKINFEKQQLCPLTLSSTDALGQISIDGDRIYFTKTHGIKDEIFQYTLSTAELKKLITPYMTNYNVNAGFSQLYWTSFTADGFQLRRADSATAKWETVALTHSPIQGIATESNKAAHIDFSEVKPFFNIEKYAKLTHPFNLHSWRPNYSDPEYSVTIYGNNILNTVETELYYLYNENDNTNALGAGISYGGLYPVIGFNSQYTMNRKQQSQNQLRKWNQLDNYLSFTIPLSWNKGKWFQTFGLQTQLGYRNDFLQAESRQYFRPANFGYLTHTVSFGRQVQQALQDLYPKFGYSVNLQYRYAIRQFNSAQWMARAALSLPGLFPTHSLLLNGALQQSEGQEKLFGNRIPFARGYNAVNVDRVSTVSANYHFPVWYPDAGFANIFYLPRIRANVFYDASFLKNAAVRSRIQSAGTEIYLDTRWWNEYGITVGFRQGILFSNQLRPGANSWFYEFILPVNLIPR